MRVGYFQGGFLLIKVNWQTQIEKLITPEMLTKPMNFLFKTDRYNYVTNYNYWSKCWWIISSYLDKGYIYSILFLGLKNSVWLASVNK